MKILIRGRCPAIVAVLMLASCTRSSSDTGQRSEPGQARETAQAAAPDAGAPFTVCDGTYALCTQAHCQTIPDGGPGKLSCPCTVHQGLSAGLNACATVPDAGPQPGQAIPSRYYPFQNVAVCTNSRPWANCLDMPCTIGADAGFATCTCVTVADAGSYVIDMGSHGVYDESTCNSGIISSATYCGAQAMTAFLENTNLKPFKMKVVNNAPLTLCTPVPH
jgi:hypothetical protein